LENHPDGRARSRMIRFNMASTLGQMDCEATMLADNGCFYLEIVDPVRTNELLDRYSKLEKPATVSAGRG
jgi:hypothetical protein